MAAVVPPAVQFDVAHQINLATGIDNVNPIAAHQGRTLAGAVGHQLFRGSYGAFRDKTMEQVYAELKILSNLTVAEGRIRLLPAQQTGLSALV